ncbi:MAG TPA: hypothetical protein VGG39_32930 [Polyangiaceae bacterium]|jgi:hypothetical protein
MVELIDECAQALRAGAGAFTRGNLAHALRRRVGREIAGPELDAALRSRRSRGALPGLLPTACRWRSPPLGPEWDAYFPKALLLVDRPAILDLFVASGAIPSSRVAVVCIDGTPASVVAWLARGFRSGRRVPVAYLHDAATVVHPFTIEPLVGLARDPGAKPTDYRDLGLRPLGVPARRFHDSTVPDDECLRELEALPPAALVRYGIRAAARMAPGDANMLPLRRGSERRKAQEVRS